MPTMSNGSVPPPLQVTDENRAMMVTLLDRIQQLTAKAGDDSKDDSKSGKLKVDRATLDEIAAHVTQLKTMLQR